MEVPILSNFPLVLEEKKYFRVDVFLFVTKIDIFSLLWFFFGVEEVIENV